MSNEASMLRTMRKLAREGMCLVPQSGLSGQPLDLGRVVDARNGLTTDFEVSGPQWRTWLDQGWLVDDEVHDGYRLSQAGHIQLKRLLSRSDGQSSDAMGVSSDRERSRDDEHEVGGPKVKVDDTPLAWLWRRRDKRGQRLVSTTEYSAGERLRSDYVRSQLEQRTTMSWSATRGGGQWRDDELTASEAALAARERVRRALASVGPEFASILHDVCCAEVGLGDVEVREGWSRRSGKVVLQLALRALARHYGFEAARSIAGDGRGPHSSGGTGVRSDPLDH